MSTFFPLDTEVRVSVNWTNAGSPQDSATLLRVEDPTGTVTVHTSTSGIVHPSTGTYYVDLDGIVAGVWEYRFEADSPKGVVESYFVVEPSRIDSLNP